MSIRPLFFIEVLVIFIIKVLELHPPFKRRKEKWLIKAITFLLTALIIVSVSYCSAHKKNKAFICEQVTEDG